MAAKANDVDEIDGNCSGKNCETDDDMAKPSVKKRVNHSAPMASEMYDDFYKMDHKHRGHALIFNHKTFRNQVIRSGAMEDCDQLTQCLQDLGFRVHVLNDLKRHEIENHIREASKWNHTKADCFLIAVLSDGEEGVIYSSDFPYKPEHLWQSFTPDKCPSLAGKPKIFIFEVGRGKKVDVGFTAVRKRVEFDGTKTSSYKIPLQADFIFIHSTPKGYDRWLDCKGRSWFINALCTELKHRAHDDHLQNILTYVHLRVVNDYESNLPLDQYKHQSKQIPCFMSTLTRFIKFSPKNCVKSPKPSDTNNNA